MLRLIASLLLLIASTPIVLLLLAIDSKPKVRPGSRLTQQQLQEIQELLIKNDPRLLWRQSRQDLHFSASELNALLDYLLSYLPGRRELAGKLVLRKNQARLDLSLGIPPSALGDYINIGLEASSRNGNLEIDTLRLGDIPIPTTLLAPAFRSVSPYLDKAPDYQAILSIASSLESVDIDENSLDLSLSLKTDTFSALGRQVRQFFVDDEEKSAFLHYYRHLLVASAPYAGYRVSVLAMLRPMFEEARLRTLAGHDPVQENRALLLSLAAYVNDLSPQSLLADEMAPLPPAEAAVVLLQRREDLAQHLLSSAAITASAGAGIADILSIYKEVHDSRYRSGFSFSDITANQSGAAIGLLATRDQDSARWLQEQLGVIESESRFMPATDPGESLSAEEFARQYGDRNSEAYQERLQNIADAVLSRPLFQDSGIDIAFEGLQ